MSILSEKTSGDALPDFRSLGVIARALVGVNFAALLAAAVRAQDLTELADYMLEIAAVLEPALLGSLIVLYAANPMLAKLPYRTGLAAVFAIVIAVTLAILWLGAAALQDAFAPGALRAVAFAILVTALLAAYFQLRARAFSPALAEARLQALQARIRPHFLFNSLNAVLSVIRSDPKRAEGAIEDLAELYRMLMADTQTLTTLANEIEVTRQYLNLEHLRLGDRLAVEWRVETAPRDALVPPLLLQPLVENAVYHGIEPGIARGTIEIAIYRDGERVHVRLTNPYHPEHQHRQGNRMALANIRERLALHFDVESRLESGAVGANWEIHMVMPYRRKA
ncbi:MAG: histidine kinase [Burkholderiales bacterium]|nr:histidine kinase [Burkholderiales bacterium]